MANRLFEPDSRTHSLSLDRTSMLLRATRDSNGIVVGDIMPSKKACTVSSYEGFDTTLLPILARMICKSRLSILGSAGDESRGLLRALYLACESMASPQSRDVCIK